MKEEQEVPDDTWLWFVPKWPLPADDGARRATTLLLRHLAALGQSIHLVAFVAQDEAVDATQAKAELGVTEVTLLNKPAKTGMSGYAWNAITRPRLPITLAPFTGNSAQHEIRQLLDREPTAPLVLDGLHAGAWIDSCCPGHRTVIYRAHNVEADIWKRAADDEGRRWRAMALRWQEQKVRHFEEQLCDRASLVLPVSDDDGEIFKRLKAKARIETVPIGMDILEFEPVPLMDEISPLLFIGRLDWLPNKDGLRWFLDKVWEPAIEDRPDLRLQIVGSGDGDWLQEYFGLPQIEFLGRVDEVAPYYRSAAATLVPIFYGSGTRVKAIESSLFGRACISTALGVEGLGFRSGVEYLGCETADEWIEQLRRLDRETATRVGSDARSSLSRRFDARKVANDMRNIVLSEQARLVSINHVDQPGVLT